MSNDSPARVRPTAVAAALVAAVVGWQTPAAAQPSGATVVHGQAQMQQQGSTLVVTTRNGNGSRHSAIDWRSFSVPAGTTTRFDQPTPDSTSINRVTGHAPSEILGTLRSNAHLVLVNQNGIAVGAGALVDTAGFTASTLRLSDPDMAAGRLRFDAAGGPGPLTVDGKVVARNGDVVIIASDVNVGAGALLDAPAGAVILAAGRKIELTGRGLEGIRLEVVGSADRVVNLGQLQGDAVGLFAGQLKHSGLIHAARAVRLEDRLHLMTASSADLKGKGPKEDRSDKDDDTNDRKAERDKAADKGDDRSRGDDGKTKDPDKARGGDRARGDKGQDAAPSTGENGTGSSAGSGYEPPPATAAPAPPATASQPDAQAAPSTATTIDSALQEMMHVVDYRAPLTASTRRQRELPWNEPDTRTMGGPAFQCTP